MICHIWINVNSSTWTRAHRWWWPGLSTENVSTGCPQPCWIRRQVSFYASGFKHIGMSNSSLVAKLRSDCINCWILVFVIYVCVLRWQIYRMYIYNFACIIIVSLAYLLWRKVRKGSCPWSCSSPAILWQGACSGGTNEKHKWCSKMFNASTILCTSLGHRVQWTREIYCHKKGPWFHRTSIERTALFCTRSKIFQRVRIVYWYGVQYLLYYRYQQSMVDFVEKLEVEPGGIF